jgi:fatty-acyl-CoA synthase
MSPAIPDLPLLTDYLDWYARTRPDAEAVAGNGERLSYAELKLRVRACAEAFVSSGVGKGDRVCVQTTPGGAFLVTFLAAAAMGAIWVGLNPRHTAPELARVIAAVQPSLIIARSHIEGATKLVMIQDGRADALDAFVGQARAGARPSAGASGVVADDPCLIVFTSGSSGQPKGVAISHRALVGAAQVQVSQWSLSPLRVLNNLPISHIGCVGDLSCFTLVAGGALIFAEKFDAVAGPRLIAAEQVTVLGQVPTQFEMMLAAPEFDPESFTSLRLIFWGGAQASENLVARLIALGPPVATSYGQTETVGSVTFTPPEADLQRLASGVGRVVPPYEVRIDAPPGEAGEVQVRSPFAMSGYWRDPEATARAYAPEGWLRTGDVGVFDQNGDLRLLGRIGEEFKSGGYNISPAEIEAAIASHPDVAETVVVGVSSVLYGRVGAGMVRLRPGARLTAADLREYLAGRLANYKIPKTLLLVDDLPKLAIGKIDKPAARARLESVTDRALS